jgi:hypothetical protein
MAAIVVRPPGLAAATKPTGLHLGLLGDLERVVDLDPELSDSALKDAVTEQKLDRPEIPRPAVDQRRLDV